MKKPHFLKTLVRVPFLQGFREASSFAFHPKAECCFCWSGRSSGSFAVGHLPVPVLSEQWYEDSTVVSRQSSVVSFFHDSRFTIHAKNLQLRG